MLIIFKILLFLKFSFAQVVFDESPIACKLKVKEKKCSLVFLGSKEELWVGHLILAQRGQKDDINNFLKNPRIFSNKIKKKSINKFYSTTTGLLNLAGHLEYDKSKSQWVGHLEAQFEKNLSVIDKKSYVLEDIYEKK